jgi:hypothetical protein
MTSRTRGLVLAAVQAALLCGVGTRYLIDRARYPHGWARTRPYDPDLPIRGRYLSLVVEADGRGDGLEPGWGPVTLDVEGDRVVARPVAHRSDVRFRMAMQGSQPGRARLSDRIAFYLPEHAVDPSHRPDGEELWVELTVPPAGPVRPLRLGVMRDGVIAPLALD